MATRPISRSASCTALLLGARAGTASPAADESGSGDGGTSDESGSDRSIPDGSGTVARAFADGRTETRDVACSVYRDQFESTVEYIDILDAEQSITFHYRETADGVDLKFAYPDTALGGLTARVAISNTALDPSDGFSADLTRLVVGGADPSLTEVGPAGTCS